MVKTPDFPGGGGRRVEEYPTDACRRVVATHAGQQTSMNTVRRARWTAARAEGMRTAVVLRYYEDMSEPRDRQRARRSASGRSRHCVTGRGPNWKNRRRVAAEQDGPKRRTGREPAMVQPPRACGNIRPRDVRGPRPRRARCAHPREVGRARHDEGSADDQSIIGYGTSVFGGQEVAPARAEGSRRRTYAEVARRAAALAHGAPAAGVDGDQRVGTVHVNNGRAPRPTWQ